MMLDNLYQVLGKQAKFRIKQANRLIFQDLISDWQAATVFPLALREELNKICPLEINGQIFTAKNNQTRKALITLSDGKKIETVLLSHADNRRTVCLSSQIGCPLACQFCATGQMGFERNLTAWEIVEQVLFWAQILQEKGKKITNLVFMGMGEPFLNYQNVWTAILWLNDPEKFGLGARHISISTCGIVEGINKLANEKLQVNLSISLHAASESLRGQLMPINKKYSLAKVMSAVERYVAKTSRRVMFEYLLIKGVNDRPAQAEELAQLMRNNLFMVNLIKYNPTGRFASSSSQTATKFMSILKSKGIAVTQRYSFGADILAACGQLATKKKK
ncbi:MAG: 23S rRNA (adenine(2503)-C(2))-methyltransferase RlmN [Patescibacteria group bacterium]